MEYEQEFSKSIEMEFAKQPYTTILGKTLEFSSEKTFNDWSRGIIVLILILMVLLSLFWTDKYRRTDKNILVVALSFLELVLKTLSFVLWFRDKSGVSEAILRMNLQDKM